MSWPFTVLTRKHPLCRWFKLHVVGMQYALSEKARPIFEITQKIEGADRD